MCRALTEATPFCLSVLVLVSELTTRQTTINSFDFFGESFMYYESQGGILLFRATMLSGLGAGNAQAVIN